MKRSRKYILPFLLILLMLAGCNSSKSSSRKMSGSVPSEAAYAVPGDYGYGTAYEAMEEDAVAESETPAAPDPNSGMPAGRKIIRNADMSIQTREYDTFMTDLQARIASVGGYIESSYANGNAYSSRKTVRSAKLTVRIQAQNLDAFLDGVCTMGNVLYKNVYSNDVTASYVDTEARLAALKTERDTLMSLLERAEKMEDIITIYERISDVTYEIESYEARIRTYDDQIAYSSVTVSVSEVERETVVTKETTWQEIERRVKENLQDIGEGFKDLFVWFVSSLPSLLLLAVIAFMIWLIVRRIVRKSRKKNAAKAAQARPAPAQKEPAQKDAEPVKKEPEPAQNAPEQKE